MITIRRASERGRFDHGWLDTRHSFSFADYHDPAHMGFRSLRVMNDDRIAPGEGFGMHPHRDMEILTFVYEGALEHKDSMGSSAVLRPGEVQHMSAGTGVLHSEFNPSPAEATRLYQVWILPDRKGLPPGYQQKAFPDREGRLRRVASPDGREGSLLIHQDAEVFVATLERGARVGHRPAKGRHAWLQVARGGVVLNGKALGTGDGAAASGEEALRIEASSPAELILFDLA